MKRRRLAARRRRRSRPASSGSVAGVPPEGGTTGPPACPLAAGRGPPSVLPTSARGSVLLTFIAHQHLIAKLFPDDFVDRGEFRMEPDLRYVPWPREINRVGSLDRAGTRGQEDDPVRERDRLFQVMRDEDDRGG